MKNNLLFLLCLLAFAGLQAQEQVVVRIGEVIEDPSLTTNVCVPISADSFPNIAAAEFSIGWDASLLTFDAVEFGANPLNILSSQTNQLNDSTLVLLWSDNELAGNSLAYQEVFMQVCFTFTADVEGMSPVFFNPDRNIVFVQEGQVTAFPNTAVDGSVTLAIDVSAVEVPAWAQEVNLFPNPTAEDFITLAGNYPALDGIALFDLNGRLIRAYAPTENRLPLTELPAGQYLLRLQVGNEQANFRLIKQ